MKRTLQMGMAGMLALAMVFFFPAAATWARMARQSTSDRTPAANLDLSVDRMAATFRGYSGHDNRVEIIVWVKASGVGMHRTCSGPFQVKVEKYVDDSHSWQFVSSRPVRNLCFKGGMNSGAIIDLRFTDTVPSDLDGCQKYQAEVDFDNRVVERNESNNIGGARYFPKRKQGPKPHRATQ